MDAGDYGDDEHDDGNGGEGGGGGEGTRNLPYRPHAQDIRREVRSNALD